MTLTGLLNPTVTEPTVQGPVFPQDIDRTEWSWNNKGGGGGWKGGKGNPNAALSALTLLAFLFFLNILQSCLKDSLNQNPGVVVMMMPTPTSAATAARVKRDVQSERGTENKEYSNHEWDDDKITELVHNQVESYWGNKEQETRKFKQNDQNKVPEDTEVLQENSQNKRISTKLRIIKPAKKDEEGTKATNEKTLSHKTQDVNFSNKSLRKKENPPTTSNWIEIMKTTLKMSQPLIRTLLCCETVVCENLHMKNATDSYTKSNAAVRNILLWLCRRQNEDSCSHSNFQLSDCKNPFVKNLLTTNSEQMTPNGAKME